VSGAQEKRQTLVAVAEMGIGNTTSASVMTAILSGQSAAVVTGKGTGLEMRAHEHKIRIVDAVIQKHFGKAPRVSDAQPLEILRRVGGLEIAAMVGLVLGAARYQIPVITDGFISTAAATVAYAVEPRVQEYSVRRTLFVRTRPSLFAGLLWTGPILTLDMRLGEGTGAVLAMPIIRLNDNARLPPCLPEYASNESLAVAGKLRCGSAKQIDRRQTQSLIAPRLWLFLLGTPPHVVLVESQDLLKRNAVLPPGLFEFRLWCELVHVPETKVGHRDYVSWDAQHLLQCSFIENAHPADADPSARAASQRFCTAQTAE
jgi:Phosphoribosyltransferase